MELPNTVFRREFDMTYPHKKEKKNENGEFNEIEINETIFKFPKKT